MPVKSKVKISQNFVAFSEYMNFTFELAFFLHELIWYVYLDDLFIRKTEMNLKFFFSSWTDYMSMQIINSPLLLLHVLFEKTCITIIASFLYELIQCVHSDIVCVLYNYFQKKAH